MSNSQNPKRHLFYNRLLRLKAYLAGDVVIKCGPSHLMLEGTSKCNLQCPMCPRELMYFPPEDMTLDLFSKIIEEAKHHLEYVVPFGGGEPLLAKNIFKMISLCHQNSICAGISTNGTVLDAEKSRDLIKSGLDYIIFAFDGASPEVFEQYRVGANFHKVRANILNFLKVKKEMKSRIFCIVQMVRMKGNAHEIGAFKRLWSVEGVDKIRVKEDEVRQHAAALSAPEVFLERPACQILWRGPMYVRYDGEAFPCCYAFREESLGNLKTQSLAELWNSSQMQAMRAAHKRRDLRAYRACQTCQARQPSLPLLMGSFLVDSLQVQKLIPAYEKLSFLSNFSANP